MSTSSTRRVFLTAAGAGVPAGLLFAPESLLAKEHETPVELDRVVVAHLEDEMIRAYGRAATRGYVVADDVHSAFSNARLMFGHFQETGLNTAIEQELRKSRTKALNFELSQENLDKVATTFSRHGVVFDAQRLRDAFAIPREARERAAERIAAKGVLGAVAEGLDALQQVEDKLAAAIQTRHGRIVTIQASADCQELAQLQAGLMLLDGMLWLGGIVIPAYGVAAALVAILIGIVQITLATHCP
jgi:hypothetical protein